MTHNTGFTIMSRSKLGYLALAIAIGTAGAAHAEPSLAPFYQAVTQMKAEGRLGQVLASEPVSTPIPGAVAWRIAYVSSDMADKKTIVTGLVIAPKGKAPKEGRPVMSWAHGTTGTAQNCGPSQVVNPVVPLNEYFLPSGNSWTDYGVPALAEFIKSGYVVVATDYQGLGGGGRHQYQLSETQARDAINAIRAAGSMKETGAGLKAIIYGWSQGAGAAIAAASSPDYVTRKGTALDGVKLVGAVAMAPPDFRTLAPQGQMTDASGQAMLAGVAKSFSNSVNNFNHVVMTLWGAQAAYPEKLKLSDVFTAEGVAFVEEVMGNKCVHAASDTINYTYGDQFTSLLRPDPVNAGDWAQTLIDSAGPDVKPMAPVIIFWGTKDTVAPPIMHKLYREHMCKLGGNIARVQLAGELTHFATPGASQPLYLPWIADRLAGKPAPDGCAAEQVQQ
jgi:pimeloyl-ACP methyl ester carboxylesterase